MFQIFRNIYRSFVQIESLCFRARRIRSFQVLRSELSMYIKPMLEMFCEKTSIAVLIGVIPEMDCLKETSLAEQELSSSSRKHYSFNGDKTVVVFSNLAEGYSTETLEWLGQKNVSVFIVVMGNIMDYLAESMLRPSFVEKHTASFIILNCFTESLIDLSDFLPCLKQLTRPDCKTPFRKPIYIEKTTEADEFQCTWRDLKDVVALVESTADKADLSKMKEFYIRELDVLFREYS